MRKDPVIATHDSSSHRVAGMTRLQNLARRRLLTLHSLPRRVFGDRHPSARLVSGHASKIGNRSPTPFLTPFSVS
jgi:hypothetical protein